VTSEEEHAVSTVKLGPLRPRRYDIRPEAMLPALPVATYPSSFSGVPPVKVA
jgi:hypothetical protein